MRLVELNTMTTTFPPVYWDFRGGDVRHSLADITKSTTLLGYQPTHRIGEGLKVAMEWYVRFVTRQKS